VKNYEFVFTQFQDGFGDRLADSITPDEILSFLTKLTDGTKQTTKRNRYSSLKAFFNYIKNSIDPNFQNPCDTPILRKIFKDRKAPPWPIFEKELIDEIHFQNDQSTQSHHARINGPWRQARRRGSENQAH
jgi:integrase